jgi:hypothetical protein
MIHIHRYTDDLRHRYIDTIHRYTDTIHRYTDRIHRDTDTIHLYNHTHKDIGITIHTHRYNDVYTSL